jgi:hypothetical protein
VARAAMGRVEVQHRAQQLLEALAVHALIQDYLSLASQLRLLLQSEKKEAKKK